MTRNHELTGILGGRRIARTSNRNDTLIVGFDDGSLMTVRTGGSSNSAVTGSSVVAVRQEHTTLELDFENGQSMTIQMAEASGCVMVRDRAGVMEYAD